MLDLIQWDDRHQGKILITTIAFVHVICKRIPVSPSDCSLIQLSTEKVRRIGGCTGGLLTEVTATGDVQSGSMIGPGVVDATDVGVAVVRIGLNALLTMELETLSRLEDRATVLFC